MNGYIILSQKKEKALVQYAKVHIFAGSYPEEVATFDDISDWESVLSGTSESHKINPVGGTSSSTSSSFIINQQQQQLASSPFASLSLSTTGAVSTPTTSTSQLVQGGTNSVIIDDYIKTSKQKRKDKSGKSKGKSGYRSDNEDNDGNDDAESEGYNYIETLFGSGLRGSAAAAASIYASKLPNGAELDSGQLQRLTDGYTRILSKKDFSGGIILVSRSRNSFSTNRLFNIVKTSSAIQDAGVLPLRVHSVWDSTAILRAIFESDAEEPVPLIIVGQSACLSNVVRPYMELIAKRPLHSKPVAFYFVPLVKWSACEVASLLAARDPEYRSLFCDEAWERQIVAQVVSRDGSPTPTLVEERILRYLHGARAEFPLVVGEATITQQRGTVAPKPCPFIESVQAYPMGKAPVSATLDFWLPPKKKGEHDQRHNSSKVRLQALALSRLPGFAVKCLGFEQKDVNQQNDMFCIVSQQTSKPAVMKMITDKLYPKKHTASAPSLPPMDSGTVPAFTLNIPGVEDAGNNSSNNNNGGGAGGGAGGGTGQGSSSKFAPRLPSFLASSKECKMKKMVITKLLCGVSQDESESSSSSSSSDSSSGESVGNFSSKGSASSRHSDDSGGGGGDSDASNGSDENSVEDKMGNGNSERKSGTLKVALDGNVFLNVRTLSVKSGWASGRPLHIKTFV